MKLEEKICEFCGDVFIPVNNKQKYCSASCCSKASYYRLKAQREGHQDPMYKSVHWKGAEKGTTSYTVRFNADGKSYRIYKMPWYDKFKPIIQEAMENHMTYGKYVARKEMGGF